MTIFMTMFQALLLVIFGLLSLTQCEELDWHFTGPNIALDGTARQYPRAYNNYTADKAIDGNNDTDVAKGYCAHTTGAFGQYNAWWNITFRTQHYITGVIILNRNDAYHRARLQGFSIVDDNLVTIYQNDDVVNNCQNYTQQSKSVCQEIIKCPIKRPRLTSSLTIRLKPGNYKYYNEKDGSMLTLCEVMVFSGTQETAACGPLYYCNYQGSGCQVTKGGLTDDRSKYQVGTVITFSCKTNYIIPGSPAIECLASGKFNAPRPLCKRCILPTVQHGRFNKNTLEAEQNIPFYCESGYTPNTNSVTCEWHGTYKTVPMPECTVSPVCQVPAPPTNGFFGVGGTVQAGRSITLQCQAGYMSSQSAPVKCTKNGNWSTSFPVCSRVMCDYPDDIPHGHYLKSDNNVSYTSGSVPYNKVINVECVRGYKVRSDKQMTCEANGEWSMMPICDSVTCRIPQHDSRRQIYLDGKVIQRYNYSVPYSTTILLKCKTGFSWRPGLKEVFMKCLETGSWNTSNKVCKMDTCSIGPVDNGKYVLSPPYSRFESPSHYPYNSVLKLICNEGYKSNASSVIICEEYGIWNASVSCEKVQCVAPHHVNGGQYYHANKEIPIGLVFEYGTRINFTCIDGYIMEFPKLSSPVTRTCQNNERWSDSSPSCKEITCPFPSQLSTGSYQTRRDTVKINETVTFECTSGLFRGTFTRRCGNDGRFVGAEPSCVSLCNGTRISNGTIMPLGGFYEETEQARVKCDDGYEYSGNSTCHRNHTWQPEPVCTAIAKNMMQTLDLGVTAGAVSGSCAVIVIVLAVIGGYVLYKRRTAAKDQHDREQNVGRIMTNESNVPIVVSETGFSESVPALQPHAGASSYTYASVLKTTPAPTKSSGNYYSLQSTTTEADTYYSFDDKDKRPDTTISVDRLAETVLTDSYKDKLSQQFEGLPKGLTASYTAALRLQNRGKNKYKNMYAYDETRVVLQREDSNDSDYINACYIHGFSKTRAYVASQGPIKNTVGDFWSMVWQLKSGKIVMLTNPIEEDKIKCVEYWPSEDSVTYGCCTVSLEKTDTYSDFVIRTLGLQKEGHEKIFVHQFHFTAWPDKSIPKYASSIVHFRNKVKYLTTPLDGPIIVHCSAGIGRTGTFIALDILTDQANRMGYVDPTCCVETLRRQRVNMVQTLEQYRFLHQTLVETLMLSSTALPASQFIQEYGKLLQRDTGNDSRKIDKEYVMLKSMSPVQDEHQYLSAKDVRNARKNRYDNVLPVSEFMPVIHGRNGENYINAVFLPSYKKKNAFILTQTPLETTIQDFWMLVVEHNVHTIVMMNNIKDVKKEEIYWPDIGQSVTHGAVTITTNDVHDVDGHHLVTMTTSLRDKTRSVQQIQYGGWSVGQSLPDSPYSILALHELVQTWQRHTGDHTVLVHCMNGVDKSGLYCVLSAVLERMKIEQDVAIVQTIEEMRNYREQIVPSLEQFLFCHEVAKSYIESNETYANFSRV